MTESQGRPLRVLVDAMALGPVDGCAVQTFQVCRELALRGHELDVLYLHDDDWSEAYRSFSRSVRQVPSMDLSPRRLHRDADGHRVWSAVVAGMAARPDVIYDNLFWNLWWGAAVGVGSRAPVVSHYHGAMNDNLSFQRRVLARRVHSYLAVSAAMGDVLAGYGIDRSRIQVVHNGIDPDQYPLAGPGERAAARTSIGLPVDAEVVAYLGGINTRKGVELLIEAAHRLTAERANLTLLIAGSVDAAGYRELVQQRAAGLTCRWLERQDDVTVALHASDVLALPSMWQEPFGRVVIEAMATGLPVVASRSGGLPEILTGEFATGLFDRGDAAGLSRAIDRRLDWRATDPGLADRCRAHVVEHFSFTKMVDAVESHLLGAAHHKGHAGL